jgi:hypothetical protein
MFVFYRKKDQSINFRYILTPDFYLFCWIINVFRLFEDRLHKIYSGKFYEADQQWGAYAKF